MVHLASMIDNTKSLKYYDVYIFAIWNIRSKWWLSKNDICVL